MRKTILAAALSAAAMTANADILEYSFTGQIVSIKYDSMLAIPEGSENSQDLLGTNVSGKVLIDTDNIPESHLYPTSNVRNYLRERTDSPSFASIKVTIDETGETFTIPFHDEINEAFTSYYFNSAIDIENNRSGHYSDKTNFTRETIFGQDMDNYVRKRISISSAGPDYRNTVDMFEPFYLNFNEESENTRSHVIYKKEVDGKMTDRFDLHFRIRTFEKSVSCN